MRRTVNIALTKEAKATVARRNAIEFMFMLFLGAFLFGIPSNEKERKK